jgi:hypothetical protein
MKRTRQRIAEALPSGLLFWTQQAALPLSELPGLALRRWRVWITSSMPKTLAQLPAIWSDPMLPICLSQGQEDGWSVGWRWHPGHAFDAALESVQWLAKP